VGFWNALSILGPIAPAMSDARDIRAQRAQDVQDLELKKAQATTQQMAAQAEQQRLRAGTQPLLKPGTQPEFNPDMGTFTQPEWNPDKNAYVSRSVPGVTPQQQEKFQLESLKRNREAAKAMMPAGTSDENLDYLSYTLSGLKPPPLIKLTQLSGDAGKPFKGADGQWYVNEKQADGTIVQTSLGANYQGPTVTKTPQNDTRFIAVTGRPESTWSQDDREFVQGYKNMIATKITNPGVSRMNALAQNRIVTPVDPNNPAAEIYTTAGQAMRQGLQAPGSIDYRLQMPTGAERGRADLAISAREQLTDMQNILRTRSDLFGPLAGKATNFTQWVGSQDPDAQRFQAAARIAADHLAGVFGGRSQKALEAIYQIAGRNTTNPAAAIAGLEQLDKAARSIQSRGVGPGAAASPAGGAGATAPGGKQHSLRTAMALPAMKGKTAAQVKAALESYGYEVVP